MEIEKLNAILSSHLKWLMSNRHEGERANLGGAYLRGADLRDANLGGANLYGADLSGADLYGAYLGGAYLRGAYLRDANLRDANLGGADLTPIKRDFYEVLATAPGEVPGLLLAIREGRVDGSTYQGECACLVGTVANLKKCAYDKIEGITPDSNRPAERFFLGIKKGDTPQTNQVSQIVETWIVEWQESNAAGE